MSETDGFAPCPHTCRVGESLARSAHGDVGCRTNTERLAPLPAIFACQPPLKQFHQRLAVHPRYRAVQAIQENLKNRRYTPGTPRYTLSKRLILIGTTERYTSPLLERCTACTVRSTFKRYTPGTGRYSLYRLLKAEPWAGCRL